jgi:hypothetical protein
LDEALGDAVRLRVAGWSTDQLKQELGSQAALIDRYLIEASVQLAGAAQQALSSLPVPTHLLPTTVLVRQLALQRLAAVQTPEGFERVLEYVSSRQALAYIAVQDDVRGLIRELFGNESYNLYPRIRRLPAGRQQIAWRWLAGWRLQEIASDLGRGKDSISRELSAINRELSVAVPGARREPRATTVIDFQQSPPAERLATVRSADEFAEVVLWTFSGPPSRYSQTSDVVRRLAIRYPEELYLRIHTLSDNLARVVWPRMAGWTLDEISHETGLSVRTIHFELARADRELAADAGNLVPQNQDSQPAEDLAGTSLRPYTAIGCRRLGPVDYLVNRGACSETKPVARWPDCRSECGWVDGEDADDGRVEVEYLGLDLGIAGGRQ